MSEFTGRKSRLMIDQRDCLEKENKNLGSHPNFWIADDRKNLKIRGLAEISDR